MKLSRQIKLMSDVHRRGWGSGSIRWCGCLFRGLGRGMAICGSGSRVFVQSTLFVAIPTVPGTLVVVGNGCGDVSRTAEA